MAADNALRPPPRPPVIGHAWRLRRENRDVTLVFLGLLMVFVLSLFHDELVQQVIDTGHLPETRAGTAELMIGLVLFPVWTGLTLRLMALVRREADAEGDIAAKRGRP